MSAQTMTALHLDACCRATQRLRLFAESAGPDLDEAGLLMLKEFNTSLRQMTTLAFLAHAAEQGYYDEAHDLLHEANLARRILLDLGPEPTTGGDLPEPPVNAWATSEG